MDGRKKPNFDQVVSDVKAKEESGTEQVVEESQEQVDASSDQSVDEGQQGAVEESTDESGSPAVEEGVETLADGTPADKDIPYTRFQKEQERRKAAEKELEHLRKTSDGQKTDPFAEWLKSESEGPPATPQPQPRTPYPAPPPAPYAQQPANQEQYEEMTAEEKLAQYEERQQKAEAEYRRQQHQAELRQLKHTFDTEAHEVIQGIADKYEMPERDVRAMAYGNLAHAFTTYGATPKKMAKYLEERVFEPFKRTAVKGYVRKKVVDNKKPVTQGSGGGIQTPRREITSFEDGFKASRERLGLSSDEG